MFFARLVFMEIVKLFRLEADREIGYRIDTRPSSLVYLLHQRHALREVILDDGANLVLDLQVTRNFFHRQHLA